MTDRFSRARSRLLTHEQGLVTKKSQAKRLGQKLPEEIVKIPKIGEWSLSNQSGAELIEENSVESKPPSNSGSKNEKENKISAPYHIKAPKAISDAPPAASGSKIHHQSGSMTTDLNVIMKSKIRAPARPLPPLKDSAPNEEDSFLPLEVFDDLSYAEFTTEELLKHPDAFSKFPSKNGEIVWEKCKVIDYDSKQELFIIEWEKNKKQKKVARFNIRFAIESEEKFNRRLQAAKNASHRYEMQFRFINRVEQMPTDYLPELSPYDLENIWIKTGIPSSDNIAHIINGLFEETKINFKNMNNQLDFIYELEHNPLIPNRDDFLSLFEKKKERTSFGLVTEKLIDFASVFDMFEMRFLKSNPHILVGLLTISETFQSSLDLSFLTNGFNTVLSLEEFAKRQSAELVQTTKTFKSSIQETLENVISSTMNDDFQGDRYQEKNLYQKMVSLTQRMLHTILLDIIKNTLNNYSSLFEGYIDSETTNLLPAQFSIDLVLSNDFTIGLSPSITVFQETILSLLIQLEKTVVYLPEINLPILDVDTTTVSFSDCVTSIVESRKRLGNTLEHLFKTLNQFISEYSGIESVLSLNPQSFVQDFDQNGSKTLDDYRAQYNEFNKVLDICQNQMSHKYKLGIFQMNCESFKDKSTSRTRSLIQSLLSHMKGFAMNEIMKLQKEFNVINDRIKTVPNTPEELSDLKKYIDHIISTTQERATQMKVSMQRFAFLEEFKFEISNDECQEKYMTLQLPHKLSMNIEETERMLQVERVRMIRELRGNQRQLETSTLSVSEALPVFISKYQDLELTIEAVDHVNEIQGKLNELKEQQDKFIQHDTLFGFEASPCKTLVKLVEEFTPLHILWNLAGEWLNMNTQWLDTPFPQVKPEVMNSFMIQATKKISKLKKDLSPQRALLEKVLNPLSEQIDKFKQNIPLISRLRHPGIKTKHWEKISEIVGFRIEPSMDLTLQGFLEKNLGRWNDKISEIASIAAQEYNIETSLDQMDAELQTKQFGSALFRGTNDYILTDVEEIVSIIDDQLVTTQTLLTSPFIAPVKKRATERLQFLRHCHDTLDAWIECQRGWLYLKPIFTGTSIQKKLHRESRDWNTVDKMWNATMTLTHNHPDFGNVMHRDHLLEDLQESNRHLESITQGLNAYLEAKRLGFPRFFFLSNDELISILSHTKDLDKIQKSMQKLFEYIASISVDDENMITHMNDDNLEKVELVNNVNTDTPEIEDWLNTFEEEMKTTLKESIRSAVPASSKKKREQWIADYPSQVILVSNQILWTTQVATVLRGQKQRGMKSLLSKYVEQLDVLTAIIRQPLSNSLRQVISCLLILEVHNRDIISFLLGNDVNDVDDFKWTQQLRSYWEEDNVLIRSINNTYEYSYEYAGNSSRLVITPLTDRCYQTLLSAFKQNMSGAPSGPAGTGKTETVRDCAKALGRPCVVYNCSEEVTPEQMSQFFAGLASSGSWSCFDEFNRINIEVLSVIAQQVRTIQNAIASNSESFILDKRTLKLNSNAAICITMNPGYAGRTELPDNLKALFRPCAMMVPDFVFISEILLFSGGFSSASSLSVKLVALFDLCRKQLSNTHHYDWGLRAMKAILSTAAKSKRDNLDQLESLLLVQSIRDCTKPRLISVDVPLFEGIIHDVFPEIESSKIIDPQLESHMIRAFQELNAQPLPIYLSKCNEIYETSLVRHGLMFVGGPMGGKSTCWKALQKCLSSLSNEGVGKAVTTYALNPKAISIPELYGLFDPITSGWSDGVLSSFIRSCSMREPKEWNWIIIDGPVDSLWIETMNSLLDDNKVLCLSSNERISLGPHVKMMFEVEDLSQASPATVSRCGMVYFDPTSLPWTSLIDSWSQINQEKYPIVVSTIRGLAEKYIPSLIKFVQVDASPIIGSNVMFYVKNMISIINCFISILRKPVETQFLDGEEAKDIDPLDHTLFFSHYSRYKNEGFGYFNDERIPEVFEYIFLFSIIWSFGSCLGEDSRVLFDNFFKDLLHQVGCKAPFPQKESVFDYHINLNKMEWVQWIDGETGLEFIPSSEVQTLKSKPIESILIPTNESATMLFFSRLFIQHNIHMLFNGSETSKSLSIHTLFKSILSSKYDCRSLPVFSCSTPSNILKVLRGFMHKRHGAYGPLTNQQLVVFLDNLGSVKPDPFGSQPPLELLRQLFDYGGWYNTSNLEFQNIVDTTIVSAVGLPGGGLFSLPERLIRHFCFIYFPKMKKNSMNQILTNLLRIKLEGYKETVQIQIKSIVASSIEVFEQCSSVLLPIPSKLHYVFSLRNIIRVFKGILLVKESDLDKGDLFTRLWYHEMIREFHDRFNSLDDRQWFIKLLDSITEKHFQMRMSLLFPNGHVLFTNFLDKSQRYREVTLKSEEVLQICRDHLDDHNRDASKQLDIVIFEEAIDHLVSLNRILAMDRGHALLIGVKSSGRKSLARLSLHMSSMEIFEIQISRTYNFNEWREDLKKLMRTIGMNDLPTGFVITNSQIVGLFQLEDISNLLIHGFIPNLFEREEIEQIKAELQSNELLTDEDPWVLFNQRIRQHLHIVLVFSPFSPIFKEAILGFPAIRNETSIDWYMPWSTNALESVANSAFTNLKMGSNSMLKSVVNMCVRIYKSVEEASLRFLTETKRFTAVTPSRYFELLNSFVDRLSEQQSEIHEEIKKYDGGVEKIRTTRAQIEQLSQQLDRDIPMLENKKKEVGLMLKDLQIKQVEVEATRQEVMEQSRIAEKEESESREANVIAQNQLAKAKPILMAAQDAVEAIDRDSLVNIKSLKKIHQALKETFEAICIIFGRQPRKVDGQNTGVKEEDYWPETLALLNDVQFIKKVKGFDVEKMTRETVIKLKKYVGSDKKEREEKLQAVQSGYQAVANLYLWVCASYDYWWVYQEIVPLQIKADKAQAKLEASQRVLAERRAHLQAVENQLANLQKKFEDEKIREKELSENVARTQIRLSRAQKIMNGLSGETRRWEENALNLKSSSEYLTGDSLLVAGALTFLGAFSPSYRIRLIDQWKAYLISEGIRHTASFSIAQAMGNDATIREWIIQGLPNDTHSIENALLIKTSKASYPLFIDPQLSGTKWIRSTLGESLVVLRFDQPDFIQRMRSCISFGIPVLIENVGLRLDPLIEPLLSREFLIVEGEKKIALGGEYIQYSEQFRLYLSTKYPNPHYSPEVCSQVSLINFTTTQDGLSDLLMNNLIEVERDDLDKKRLQIMEANAANIKKMKEVEEEILQIVSNAGSDILDDDNAIDTLQRAQKTSSNIEQQMAASEKTERQISVFKEKFISVAERAALLYFCTSDFSIIDPMYQFSLKWFVSVFKNSIMQSDHPQEPSALIHSFNSSICKSFYQAVTCSLFSRHKLLFSTLMAIRLQLLEKKISTQELAFLLSPIPSKDSNPTKWMPDEIWQYFILLPTLSENFFGILETINSHQDEWISYIHSETPETASFPFKKKLSLFQRLIVLRVFHLHRVSEGLRLFVSESLGKEFIAPPPLNLVKVFKESSPLSPLIFIITPAIDPQDEIINVAQTMELERYLKSYSLGRGRGAGAEELIQDSAEKGFWVLLQNCHLSLSWMPKLEHIIDNLDPSKVHSRFRLCLVTMSSPDFPIGILYQGSKLIYEIPKGIRENMLRVYTGFNSDDYVSDYTTIERQLTFHLSFFHSVVLERIQFGSIGWNIPYEFNPSDLAISRKHLKSFLAESPETIPFESLSYVIGQLNYGGRVTDKWDRRLLISLLKRYFSQEINKPGFNFGEKYSSPDFNGTLASVEDVISKWPVTTEGIDVGLSRNASTITARNQAMSIFNSLIEIQPTLVVASGSMSEEQFSLNLIESLIKEIPNPFNIYTFTKSIDISDTINTVLHHEVLLYNQLLVYLKNSLITLQKGLKGFVVIDEELEHVHKRILANKIPESWLRFSYPSILTLRSYIDDLKQRISFLDHWIRNGKPKVFRLSAFYHPEEFLTAVLQVFARKHKVPFDRLQFSTIILDTTNPDTIAKEPEDGIYVENLFMEGAKWDLKKRALLECEQTELISILPIIHFLPTAEHSFDEKNTFECTMYRMQNRGTGALDLPNYIMSLFITTPNQSPDHWIQRSVAVFITVQS